MSRHIIHKQKVTLQVPKKEDAHFFQNRVSDLMQNELPGQIENLLNNLFPSDKVVRIESVRLDLGNLSASNFDKEFKDEFLKALTKSLSSQKDSLTDANTGNVLSSAQSLVNSLIYFLEKGHLPWYRTAEKTTEWETELLNNLTPNEYEYFLDWVRDNYKHNPTIIERLVLQFSDRLLEKLILTIAPPVSEPWPLIYKDYTFLLKSFLKGRGVIRDEIWKYLFYVLLNNRYCVWAFRVLKLLANNFAVTSSDITIMKQVDIRKKLKTALVKDAFKELIIFLKNKEASSKRREAGERKRRTGRGEAGIDDMDDRQLEITEEDTPIDEFYDNGKELTVGWSRDKGRKWETDEEALYVNNSGIVILHFFLKPFFEDLKLFVAGKFKNEKAHQRAVLLLHYLATGMDEVAEFDLALQKILCGYPLDSTLPVSIKLTAKEKTESEKLLRTVIDYWEPLKNTSIEGFRNTFLQRDGKLVTKENGWQLIVEQKTVDILLGKLPWGFSTIRLPWMEQILNVDWY